MQKSKNLVLLFDSRRRVKASEAMAREGISKAAEIIQCQALLNLEILQGGEDFGELILENCA